MGRVMGMCVERYSGEELGWSKSLRLCQRKEGSAGTAAKRPGCGKAAGFQAEESATQRLREKGAEW